MRVSLLAIVAVAFVFALGGTAVAQDSPTTDTYGGVLGNEVDNSGSSEGSPSNVVSNEAGAQAGAPAGADTGSLPFTGLELGLVVLAGIGLVALGLAMRRTTRRPPAV
jgi:hypothetical protein